jgi:Threonine dehydratase
MNLSPADVRAAADRIRGRVRRTPVIELEHEELHPSGSLWLKLEFLQHTGSFKPRGAFNRILKAAEDGELPEVGVIAASGGNAGLGVAYAAQQIGVRARVFVPTTAPRVKVEKLRKLGAEVVQTGQIYNDAYQAAVRESEITGALFCHAYDQPEVCAGQGTLGLELLDQVQDIDTVLVAVGGGGLLAGVAAAVHGHARVIAVEPERAPTLNTALAEGRPTDVEVSGIAADSLGASVIGEIAYRVAVDTQAESVLVTEDAIREARRFLWDKYRIAVEYGAATSFAALLSGAYKPQEGERLAVVICGANTDPSDLAS